MNSYDKQKVVTACQNTLESIEDARKKSKGEHASFLHGQQEIVVRRVLQAALHCFNNTEVYMSNEEFSSIHNAYKEL